MGRTVVSTSEAARADIDRTRSLPPWLEADRRLPFQLLSPDEFEVLSYLLLQLERPHNRITYFGKTRDAGRDIVASGGQTELIQCKRYEGNVGVEDVRSELRKLSRNIVSGRIPLRPEVVTFYVAMDLTADARDLLDRAGAWSTFIEELFADQPERHDPTFLSAVGGWEPQLLSQSGHDLTTRLRKFPALIEEFFSVRKVITGDMHTLLARFDALERRLVSTPAVPEAADILRASLARVEAAHPSLDIKVEVAERGTNVIVGVKEPGVEVPVGELKFPDTEQGARGLEKFIRFRDHGEEAELLEGEFIWTPAITLDGDPGARATGTLKLTPSFARPEQGVRLIVQGGGDAPRLETFCKMQILRAGEVTTTVRLGGGRLCAELELSIPRAAESGTTKVIIRTHLAGRPVRLARETVEILLAIVRDGRQARIESLDDDRVCGHVRAAGAVDPGHFERLSSLLLDLTSIEREFAVALTYPDRWSDAELKTVEMLASAIGAGRYVEEGSSDTLFSDALDEDTRERFLADLANGKQINLSGRGELELSLLGVPLGRVEVVITLIGLALRTVAAENVEDPGVPDGSRSIPIACEYVIREFPRWRQESNSASE